MNCITSAKKRSTRAIDHIILSESLYDEYVTNAGFSVGIGFGLREEGSHTFLGLKVRWTRDPYISIRVVYEREGLRGVITEAKLRNLEYAIMTKEREQ